MNINGRLKNNFDKLHRHLDIQISQDKKYVAYIIKNCGNQMSNKNTKYSTSLFGLNIQNVDMTMEEMLIYLKSKHNWPDETFEYIKHKLGL